MIRTLPALAAVACFALPVAALAQVSSTAGKTLCNIGGKTYYQNGPCPGGAQASGESDMGAYMRRLDEEEARVNPLCRNYATKEIYIGIKEAELRCFYRYRDPSQVNVTTTARGTRKQYVYKDFGEYLYVEDGVVTSMQGQQR